VTVDADRIHGLEEEELVVAEEILHVVLGRGDQHVDAGVVQKPVEVVDIEGDRLGDPAGVDGHPGISLSFPAEVFRPKEKRRERETINQLGACQTDWHFDGQSVVAWHATSAGRRQVTDLEVALRGVPPAHRSWRYTYCAPDAIDTRSIRFGPAACSIGAP